MPWVKLDDQFPDHPKVVEAGPEAAWLCVAGWCYAARYLTDGFVPAKALSRLAVTDTPPAELAEVLVDVGLWEPAEGGWRIHDWHDYNPSSEKVAEERQKARERMRKHRQAPKGKPGGSGRLTALSYLERAADEPGTLGQQPSRMFDHLDAEVRSWGQKLIAAKYRPKEERRAMLDRAISQLGL